MVNQKSSLNESKERASKSFYPNLIFTSFLMWVFDKFSPYSYQNNMEKYKDDDEKRFFNFKECLWFCMTSLTPQGGGEAPKNLSGRILLKFFHCLFKYLHFFLLFAHFLFMFGEKIGESG